MPMSTPRENNQSQMGAISFRPVGEDDFALLATWLAAPHVARWWGEPADGVAVSLELNGRVAETKTLTVAPSPCARPAKDCDVVATGAVRRSDYDMDDWMMAVSDRVVFVLRARLKEPAN